VRFALVACAPLFATGCLSRDTCPTPDEAPGFSAALCANLVLAYHFDRDQALGETDRRVRDFAGSNVDLTCTSAGCPTYDPTGGRYGGAFVFDGVDDVFNNSLAALMPTSSSGTWMAWVQFRSLVGDPGYQTVIARDTNNCSCHDLDIILLNGGIFGLRAQPAGALYEFPSMLQAETDVWYHTAATFSPEGATLYVDGGPLLHIPEFTGGVDYTSSPFAVGGGGGGTEEGFANSLAGSVDEVAVFDRELSASEIRDYLSVDAPLECQ